MNRQSHPRFEQVHTLQLEMVRATQELVESPPIPEGYVLRQLDREEEPQYDELFRLAFDDEGRFEEIWDCALAGGFFVVEDVPSGHLVASCVALQGSSSPRHPQTGQLGWLVTDPLHLGKGLGTLVSAAATNRLCSEGYTRPFLGTEDHRVAAISIYLKLGWKPFVYAEGMSTRWDSICGLLQSRSLRP